MNGTDSYAANTFTFNFITYIHEYLLSEYRNLHQEPQIKIAEILALTPIRKYR